MTKETKSAITKWATIIGAVSVIQAGIVSLVVPFANDWFDERFKESIKSPTYKVETKVQMYDYFDSKEFKLFAIDFMDEHDLTGSGDSQLRIDLSNKMNVDVDEVHIEIGRMFLRFKNPIQHKTDSGKSDSIQ